MRVVPAGIRSKLVRNNVRDGPGDGGGSGAAKFAPQ